MDGVWTEDRVTATVEELLGRKVRRLTRVTTGFGSAKWIVGTDSGRVLFKVVQGRSKLRRLERAVNLAVHGGVATPPIVCSGFPDETSETGFLVHEYWEGEDSERLLPALPKMERSHFFSDFGGEVARLHRTMDNTPFNWVETAQQRLEVLVVRNKNAAFLSHDEIGSAERKVRQLLDETGGSVQAGLMHGDLYPPNLLSNDGRFRAILDFDHAKIYDPVFDFVKLRMWTFQSPQDEDDFLRGYGRDVIEKFDQRYSVCLGLELLAGFPYWTAEKNEKLLADYRREFDKWLIVE